MSQENTQLENKFKFVANAPIKTAGAFAALIDSARERIEPVLPQNINFEEFKTNLRNSVIEMPSILDCTQESIIQAMLTACDLGLYIGKARGEAYIIPFNNGYKDKQGNWYKKKEATLIPGYKGLVKQAYASGNVELIESTIVYSKDKWKYGRSMNKKGELVRYFDHEPYIPTDERDSPGEIQGCYCIIKLSNQEVVFDYLTRAELNKIRNSSKSKNSPAYSGWLSEMFRKGAFKRTQKWAKIEGARWQKTIEQSNLEFEFDDSKTPQEDREKLNELNKELLEEAKVLEETELSEEDRQMIEAGAPEEFLDGVDTNTGEVIEEDDVDNGEAQGPKEKVEGLLNLYFSDVLVQKQLLINRMTKGKTGDWKKLSDGDSHKLIKIFERAQSRLSDDIEVHEFLMFVNAQHDPMNTVRSVDVLIKQFRDNQEADVDTEEATAVSDNRPDEPPF